MESGIFFDEISTLGLHSDARRRCRATPQAHLRRCRNCRAHIHVLRVRREPGRTHLHVVRIKGHVCETKTPVASRNCLAAVARNWIRDLNLRAGDYSPSLVLYDTLNRSRIPQLRSRRNRAKAQTYNERQECNTSQTFQHDFAVRLWAFLLGGSRPLNEAARLPRRTRRTEDSHDRAGIGRIVLSGGRCAARTKKRNFIGCSLKNRPRIVPTRNLRSGGDTAKSDCQYRSMQRL